MQTVYIFSAKLIIFNIVALYNERQIKYIYNNVQNTPKSFDCCHWAQLTSQSCYSAEIIIKLAEKRAE